MARLRKPSPMDIVFTAPSDTRPRRSSPRKAAHDVSYIMSDDEDTNLSFIPKSSKRGHRYATSQDITEDSFHVPRMSAVPEPMTPRRQRALRPVESNSRLLRKLSDQTLASPEKSEKRVRSGSPDADVDRKKNLMYARRLARSVVKKQGVKGRIDVVGAAEVLEPTPSKREEQVVEVEVGDDEMETSLLCGDADDAAQEQAANDTLASRSSEERSSEELSTEEPSADEEDDEDDDEPIVAARPRQRRPQARCVEDSESDSDEEPTREKPRFGTSMQPPLRKGDNTISNWAAHEVVDLTGSPEPPNSFDIPLAHTRTTSFASSRPATSSSDAPLAILTYSPTPTKKRSPCKAPPVSRPVTPPVLSANPSKLVSPSKKKPLVSAPDLRPSLDAFWNPEVVNDWHDRQSPAKPLVSPKKQKWREDIAKLMDGITLDDDSSNEDAPPSPVISPKKKTPAPKKDTASAQVKEARAQRKDFAANKHAIATAFLEELDTTICSGAIAELTTHTGGIKLVWSKTLKTTAGRANWRREQIRVRDGPSPTDVRTETRHHCSIELAEKVIDDTERLYNVLAHEFCHLTTFMISGVRNNPHGAEFKTWGRKATAAFADRGVEVTTKHSYAIEYKYIWECVECGYEFKRHSKSIDPLRHSCGKCKGKLAQTKPVPRGGAKGTDGKAPKSGYQLFVKENFKRVKEGMVARGEDAQMGKVMEAVAREYRAAKEEKEKAKGADGLEAALDELKI